MVRFAPGTKSHDGLSLRSQILQSSVLEYFEYSTIALTKKMFRRKYYIDDLRMLVKDLKHLALRLNHTELTPLMFRGGGAGYSLSRSHQPFLVDMITDLVSELETFARLR